MDKPLCFVCRSAKTTVIFRSKTLISITSDLRVWPKGVEVIECLECGNVFKNANKVSREIKALYTNYQLFDDEEEKDQAIFLPNSSPKSRSQILVESLPIMTHLPKMGKFLDIGCNKGLLIKEFSTTNPNWSLYGYEISQEYERYVKKARNFKKFYCGDISGINEQFDCITLIHTLEHITNPAFFLKRIRKLLAPGGLLLIQVPNFRLNPFDVLIYEHLSHFYPETLEALLINNGFEIIVKNLLLVPKEITFICKLKDVSYSGQINFGSFLKKCSKANINFLDQFSNMVMKLKNKKKLIVFGAAEAGTWVSGLLKDNMDYFVDESPWRIGRTHLDKSIKHPRVLKKGDDVILAMAPILAKRVKLKWQKSQAKFWYPAD